jgi:starvation-inducible DNA-binding protein
MSRTITVDSGLSEQERAGTAAGLAEFLADTFNLYIKTHYFHWNVTGPRFRELHLMFEEEYNELWQAVDLIAERIRALGAVAPGTYRDFSRLSSIPEPEGVPPADAMVEELLRGHEAVARTGRKVFATAEGAGDQVTMDLLTERLQVHEKTAWMLRSMLE